MRFPPLIATLFVGLTLSLSIAACDGDDGESTTAAEAETTGDGDGDTGDDDTGDGDSTGGECFPQPEICGQFVRCIAALVPGQAEGVEAQYGEGGTCWCGTSAEAQTCYDTCGSEVAKALVTSPTQSQCHESVCGIEELDPDEPYGPVVDGICTDQVGPQGAPIPQTPVMSPGGVAGHYCAPTCSGIADYCPDHSQTSAEGTCALNDPELGLQYCAARCYVDSEFIGGHQCQCGATCRPIGAPDGEGQMRGFCTFD